MSSIYNNVPRGTIDEYVKLLKKWNEKINLVSFEGQKELYERHIEDSLQLLSFIAPNEEVFDLGSGAGFPGILLSYAGIKKVNLIEKITKKANFLILASALSANKVLVHNCAIEDIEGAKADVITARGFADLDKIFFISQGLIRENTRFILLKGKKLEEEIKKALENWTFEYIINKSKISDEGYILEVRNLKKNAENNSNS